MTDKTPPPRKTCAVPYRTVPGDKPRVRLLMKPKTAISGEAPTILSQLSTVSSTDASVYCLSEVDASPVSTSRLDPEEPFPSGSPAVACHDDDKSSGIFPQQKLAINTSGQNYSRNSRKAKCLKGTNRHPSAEYCSTTVALVVPSSGQKDDSRSEATDVESIYNFELSPEAQRKLLKRKLNGRRKYTLERKLLKLIERTRAEIQVWREKYNTLIAIQHAGQMTTNEI